MYKLYYYPGNANLVPHVLLEEIGAKFELVLLDRDKQQHRSPEYLKLNPHGRIPTLVDGDLVLYETAAICLHLCDRHPEARLAPELGSAERAHFYKWLIYLTNTVQAGMITYYYPERWASSEAGAKDVKARVEQQLNGMFDTIEQALGEGPYLLGKHYTAADPYLLMLGRWSRGFGRPARTLPKVGKLMETVMARPTVQCAYKNEGLAAPFY
ncbi:MAG TPA: glutathione S-transferase family protein [Stellaceae bacterium]|nr:glutathione S-transferase family protein [Stellaceae bacterium]